MKKYILIILAISCLQTIKAQEKSNSIEIESGTFFIDNFYRSMLVPKYTIHKNKHQLGIGPTILIASEFNSTNNRFPKFTGVETSYKYFANGFDNKLNLYFSGTLTLQDIKDPFKTVEWQPSELRYAEYEYLNREILITAYVGYGINFKLGEKFNLNQSAGIGFYSSTLDGDELTEGAPEVSDREFVNYVPTGLTYRLNIGIQYHF